MKFGVLLPSGWRGELDRQEASAHLPALQAVARQTEELGYDSVWAYDHLLREPGRAAPDPRHPSWPIFEAWTLSRRCAPAGRELSDRRPTGPEVAARLG